MEPTVAELAEDAAAHVLPRPGFETIHRDELFFEAGRHRASMQRLRLDGVAATVDWAREECARRGVARCEWWVGCGGLGFRRHGVLRLFTDPGVASRHGDD